MIDPAVDVSLRAALALLLLSAAWHKLHDPGAFRAALAAYRIVPAATAPVVVAAELGAAVALLLPMAGATGPLLAAALLALYGVAIAVNLARGRRHIDCGCGGPARQPLAWWLVGRNAVLAAAALACVVPSRPRPLVWIDALTVAGTVATLAMLYLASARLLADAPHLARLRESA